MAEMLTSRAVWDALSSDQQFELFNRLEEQHIALSTSPAIVITIESKGIDREALKRAVAEYAMTYAISGRSLWGV